MRALVLVCINQQHTKFEVRSFTDSKDIIGAKLKMGHVTLIMNIRARLIYLSVIKSQALDIFYMHTKCGDCRFIHSKDMTVGVKIKNGAYDPDHAPLGVVCHP